MDLFKGVMMAAVVLFAIVAALAAGPGAVASGITFTGEKMGGFSWGLFTSTAGFPFFFSLVCGGPLDQSLFQRYFSVAPGPKRLMRRSFFVGVAFFAAHMVGGAVLGLLAANPSLEIHVTHSSIAGYAALEHLVPTMGVVFAIGVAVAFLATGDSALNASSSVCALDMYKGWLRKDASEDSVIFVQRLCMLVFVVFAVFITEQGFSYFAMVTGVGVLRSALIVPAIVGMFMSKERVPDVFPGIIVGMVLSALFFVSGHEFVGSLCGVTITSLYCIYQAYVRPLGRCTA